MKENPSQNKKNITSKKWFVPSIYIGCVALILIGAIWAQGGQGQSTSPKLQDETAQTVKNDGQQALEVAKNLENFAMPLADSTEVVVKGQFYDINGDEQAQEAALVKYGDTYQPNTGMDYSLKNNTSFDVIASMSGKVTRVQTDGLLGNVVEIEHEKGLVTQYSSVANIAVKVGDQVMQGAQIAKAGKSEINKDAGVHVHFEVRKDGVAVNPSQLYKKPLSALKEMDIAKTDSQPATKKATPKENNGTNSQSNTTTNDGNQAGEQSETDETNSNNNTNSNTNTNSTNNTNTNTNSTQNQGEQQTNTDHTEE